jgi:hypothetical protein
MCNLLAHRENAAQSTREEQLTNVGTGIVVVLLSPTCMGRAAKWHIWTIAASRVNL